MVSSIEGLRKDRAGSHEGVKGATLESQGDIFDTTKTRYLPDLNMDIFKPMTRIVKSCRVAVPFVDLASVIRYRPNTESTA